MHTSTPQEETNIKKPFIKINWPDWLKMPKFGKLNFNRSNMYPPIEGIITGGVFMFVVFCLIRAFCGPFSGITITTSTAEKYGNQDSIRAAKYAAPPANDYYNISAIFSDSIKLVDKYGWQPSQVQKAKTACIEYVEQFAPVAVSEMSRYGIPASITLAQGLYESDAGQSRLTQKNNNHFGVKCFKKTCKKGHCHNFSDDTHKDFFKAYKTPWESYRGHSLFLKKSNYKALFKLDPTDYEGWAEGLKKAGYATDKKYPQKLKKIIETLNLTRFDNQYLSENKVTISK